MFEYFQMIAGNRLPDECVEIVKGGKENCEISVSAQCFFEFTEVNSRACLKIAFFKHAFVPDASAHAVT